MFGCKVGLLIAIILYSCMGYANDIEHRPINLYSQDYLHAKFEQQEKEIRQLLNRVELLEYQLIQLINKDSKRLSNVEQDTKPDLDEQLSSNNKLHTSNELNSSQGSILSNSDVFDVQDITPKNAASLTVLSEKQLYDRALIAFKDNKLDESEKLFSSFINECPNSSFQSNARFWYAEIFFKKAQYMKAAELYLKSYKLFPNGNKAADSLLKLGILLGKMNKTEEACQVLTKLEREFTNLPTSLVKRIQDTKSQLYCK
ncbi:MAG: tetratricopeptide repeat protein [Rickettsiaceae bacterium]